MGTPEFAVASLKALHETGVDIAAVVTVPDRPAGRGRKITFSPVKEYALEHRLALFQPEKLRDPEFISALRDINADLFVVVAFRMLPKEVWSMPPLGTVNLHASLLPQYRGAAPIHRAIINGETCTGVTTFLIEKEIDTGKILMQQKVPIGPLNTTGELHDQLMSIGAGLLLRTVDALSIGTLTPLHQQEVSTEGPLRTAPKLFRQDGCIHWSLPSRTIFNLIRGLSPYPAAWTTLVTPSGTQLTLKIYAAEFPDVCLPGSSPGALPPTPNHPLAENCTNAAPGTIHSDGKKYLQVATGDGWLSLTEVQMEGKKRMSVSDFLRGLPNISEHRIT